MTERLIVKQGISVGLAVAVAAVGCTSPPRAPDSAQTQVKVSTSPAELSDLVVRFESGGIVRARETAVIASRVMATIANVHVRPGDRVRRGQPLVTLDGREIEANRARAVAASLAATESARAAEADVSVADSALVLARANRDRISSLHSKRSATSQELDQAVAALTAAEAQLSGARSRLAATRAARDAGQAAQVAADVDVTYSVLSAPFDGIVTERRADPGSMATPGAPLLTVEQTSAFRLEVQADESRAGSIIEGQRAQVRIDAVAGAEDGWIDDARVAEIARIDPVSHNFLIKIDLPPRPVWRSGLFGRARFTGGTRRALTIPTSALVLRGQLTLVFLADADSARMRPIAIGQADSGRVEVLAGLREHDVVITNPPPSLVDGTRISGVGR